MTHIKDKPDDFGHTGSGRIAMRRLGEVSKRAEEAARAEALAETIETARLGPQAEPSRLALGPNTVLPTGEAVRNPVQGGTLNRQVTDSRQRAAQQADALNALTNFASPEARRLMLHEPASQRRAAVRREQIAPDAPQRRRNVAEVQSMFGRGRPGADIEFSPEIAAIGDSRRFRLTEDEAQHLTPEQRIFAETGQVFEPADLGVVAEKSFKLLTEPFIDIPGLPKILEPSLGDLLFLGLGVKAAKASMVAGESVGGIFAPIVIGKTLPRNVITLIGEDVGARLFALGAGELAEAVGAGPSETLIIQLGAGLLGAIAGGRFAAGTKGVNLREAGERAATAGRTLTEETMLAMGRAVENFDPRLQPFGHMEAAGRTQARRTPDPDGGDAGGISTADQSVLRSHIADDVGPEALVDRVQSTIVALSPAGKRQLAALLRPLVGTDDDGFGRIGRNAIALLVDDLILAADGFGSGVGPSGLRGQILEVDNALRQLNNAPIDFNARPASLSGRITPDRRTSDPDDRSMSETFQEVNDAIKGLNLGASTKLARDNPPNGLTVFGGARARRGQKLDSQYDDLIKMHRQITSVSERFTEVPVNKTAARLRDAIENLFHTDPDANAFISRQIYDLGDIAAENQNDIRRLQSIADPDRKLLKEITDDAREAMTQLRSLRNILGEQSGPRPPSVSSDVIRPPRPPDDLSGRVTAGRFAPDPDPETASTAGTWRSAADMGRELPPTDSPLLNKINEAVANGEIGWNRKLTKSEKKELEDLLVASDVPSGDHKAVIRALSSRRKIANTTKPSLRAIRNYITQLRRAPAPIDSASGVISKALKTGHLTRAITPEEYTALSPFIRDSELPNPIKTALETLLRTSESTISPTMREWLQQLQTSIGSQRAVHPFDSVTRKVQEALQTNRGSKTKLKEEEVEVIHTAATQAGLHANAVNPIIRALDGGDNILKEGQATLKNLRKLAETLAENEPSDLSRRRLDPNAPEPTVRATLKEPVDPEPVDKTFRESDPDRSQLPLRHDEEPFGTGGSLRPIVTETSEWVEKQSAKKLAAEGAEKAVAPHKPVQPINVSAVGSPEKAAARELNRIFDGKTSIIEENIPKVVKRNAIRAARGKDVKTAPLDLGDGIKYQTFAITPESQRGLLPHEIVRNDAWARGAVPANTRADITKKTDRLAELLQLASEGVDPHNVPGEVAAEMNAILRSLQGVDSRGFTKRQARRLAATLLDIPGAMQTMWTMLDVSSILRQGLILLSDSALSFNGKRRKQAFNAVTAAVHAFFLDPDRAVRLNAVEYKRALENGFIDARGFVSKTGREAKLTEREQVFAENIVDRMPVIGNIKKRSEASFSLFLNKMRNDTWEFYLDSYKKSRDVGEVPAHTREAIADFLNAASGKGDLGPLETDVMQRSLFFALGFQVSRVQVVTRGLLSHDKFVRQQARRSIGKMFAMGVTTLAILKYTGLADVETDPRSSDFGQIRVGSSRIDMWAGFRPWAVFLGRAAALPFAKSGVLDGNIKTLGTGEARDTSIFGLAENFITNKLGPFPGTGLQLARGKDISGQPFGLKDAALVAGIPLILQNVYEANQEEGFDGTWTAIPEFFGMGTSTFEPTGAVVERVTGQLFEAELVKHEHYRDLDGDHRDLVNAHQEVKDKRAERVEDDSDVYVYLKNARVTGENGVLDAINANANPKEIADAVRAYQTGIRIAGEALFADDDRPDPRTRWDAFSARYWDVRLPHDPMTGDLDFYAQSLEREAVLDEAREVLTKDEVDRLTKRRPGRFETDDPRVIAAIELYQDTVQDLGDSGLFDQDRLAWQGTAEARSIDQDLYPTFSSWQEEMVKRFINTSGLTDDKARERVATLPIAKAYRDVQRLRRERWFRKIIPDNAPLIRQAADYHLYRVPADLEPLFNVFDRRSQE